MVMSSRRWLPLIAAVALCLSGSAASAQRTGTILRNTMTFQAPDAGVLEFNVTDKQVAASTVLKFELGPEGQASTGPALAAVLPVTVKFTVSVVIGGVTTALAPFSASSDQDQIQVFGTKSVVLRRLNRANAPDLYELSVTQNA